MKILMIVDAAPPQYSGAGQQAYLLARRLQSEGFDVELVARRKEDTDPNDGFVRFLGPYISNERISSLLFALAVFFYALRERPDLIHCHGAFYYGVTSSLVARILRVPFILKITLLGTDDPKSVSRASMGPLCIGRILSLQFRLADVVIALNEESRHSCDPNLVSGQVLVIPNGVDLDAVSTYRLQRGVDGGRGHVSDREVDTSSDLRVCFIGEASIRKGTDVLLKAWADFAADRPNYRLAIAGPWESDYLLQQASSLGVEIMGKVPRDAITGLLERSDIFVLPSRAEGLPNALIEAMSMGVPCVASDIPVSMSVLEGSGVAFESGSTSGLVAALESAAVDLAALSSAAMVRSCAFDIAATVARYTSLYKELAR